MLTLESPSTSVTLNVALIISFFFGDVLLIVPFMIGGVLLIVNVVEFSPIMPEKDTFTFIVCSARLFGAVML